jgi:hypothetical protein
MSSMIEAFQEVSDFIYAAPIIIRIVAATLGLLLIFFIIRFLAPAIAMRIRFGSVIRRLRRIRRESERDVSSISAVFARDNTLRHLWTEYEHTLHRQVNYSSSPTKQGEQNNNIVHRSTVPAATIFTAEALVDSRLSTEFFKHLPGIFTGVGIIGTFSGLIQGLRAFKVSDNATEVRRGLEILMHGVYEAFLLSAVAIFAAMFTTFLERSLIAALYKQAEEITFEIDGMFQAGVGEEYLERLVNAAEDGTAQSKILKDALVTDLANVLNTLTQRQIEAQALATQELGMKISNGLREGLSEPLAQIAKATGTATQGNTQAVEGLLTDVLAGFSQRLEDLFGSQIGGINQLQQQTIEALTNALGKLEQMAANIDAAGTKSSETMAQKLAEAIASMEDRQRAMDTRVTAFVEQIGRLVRDEQSETSQKIQSTITEIGEAVRLQIAALDAAGERVAGSHAEREKQLAAQADETVSKLASATEAVMGEIRALTAEIQRSTEAMRATTSDVVARMNGSAETLARAAGDFSNAGNRVTDVLQQAAGVSGNLREVAGSLSSSSGVLKGVMEDHSQMREKLAAMLTELQATVDGAKREASITADVLQRIEGSAQKLAIAKKDVDEFLSGVTEALATAHGDFATGLQKVVGEAHNEFYTHLSDATGLLRDAIEDLAVAVTVFPSGRPKAPAEQMG